jgi:septum formation protein
MNSLVLASKSPRRESLLSALGWKFRIVDPEIRENNGIEETPRDTCMRLAIEKAGTVSRRFPQDIVIGADTIVVLEGKALGKPKDDGESIEMIRCLSGRCHEVMTGIAVCKGDCCLVDVETTKVSFRPLSSREIEAYVATGEGKDKAGAYAIQGKGSLLVSKIDGCYFNVVGLPLYRLSLLLGRLEISLSRQWEGFE